MTAAEKAFHKSVMEVRAKQKAKYKAATRQSSKGYHTKLSVGFQWLGCQTLPGEQGTPLKGNGPRINTSDVPLMDQIERNRSIGDEFYLNKKRP